MLRLAPLLALLTALACGSPEPVAGKTNQGPDRPLVAVTVPPLAFFVERLAGDAVEIAILVPPGASPASWEPGIAELRALARASLYVKVGHPHLPFERGFIADALAENATLAVLDGFGAGDAPDEDPHLWLSPRRARSLVAALHDALLVLLPEARVQLAERRALLDAEIAAVDAELRGALAECSGMRFWVFHPAWGHFAREYGLEQVAIERDHKEPDPRQLASLIREGREAGVEVIFVQPQFDPRAAELVAREIGARLETLDPLARDWSDNLRRAAGLVAEAARG